MRHVQVYQVVTQAARWQICAWQQQEGMPPDAGAALEGARERGATVDCKRSTAFHRLGRRGATAADELRDSTHACLLHCFKVVNSTVQHSCVVVRGRRSSKYDTQGCAVPPGCQGDMPSDENLWIQRHPTCLGRMTARSQARCRPRKVLSKAKEGVREAHQVLFLCVRHALLQIQLHALRRARRRPLRGAHGPRRRALELGAPGFVA